MDLARRPLCIPMPSQNPCIDCGKPTNRTKAAKRCHACAGVVAQYQNTGMYRVKLLIQQGVIQKPNVHACVDCGAPATCYDHRDYSKPWQVEPVCARCNNVRGAAVTPPARKLTKAEA